MNPSWKSEEEHMRIWNLLRRKECVTDFRGRPALIFSIDQGFLNYYRELTTSLGLIPFTAATSERAANLLWMTRVALVVVDQGRGVWACTRVLKCTRKAQKHAVTLVISNDADSFFREEALSAGASDFLAHPVLREDLLQALIPSRTHVQRPLRQTA